MTRNQAIVDASGGGLVAVLGNIYQQGVEQSMPWLIAMTLVVCVDLAVGLRRCWMTKEPIRWSKGFRATISKLVCYWAYAICAVCVQVACENAYHLAMWACLSVIAIEFISIIGNILRAHGLELNVVNLFKSIGKKVDVDMDGVVTKSKKTKK